MNTRVILGMREEVKLVVGHGWKKPPSGGQVLRFEKWSNEKGIAPGWKLSNVFPFTPLQMCGRCGFVSTPKRVHLYPLNGAWAAYRRGLVSLAVAIGAEGLLCHSCYNQLRSVIEPCNDMMENRRLLKQINYEVKNARQD
jgi:hypothetical protein